MRETNYNLGRLLPVAEGGQDGGLISAPRLRVEAGVAGGCKKRNLFLASASGLLRKLRVPTVNARETTRRQVAYCVSNRTATLLLVVDCNRRESFSQPSLAIHSYSQRTPKKKS
jgi:hypothetical protein